MRENTTTLTSLSASLPKGSVWNAWRVRRRVQGCGKGLKVIGRPTIINQGQLELGSDCVLRADLLPLRLAVSPGASLYIGDRCFLNGVIIAATVGVTLGDDCWLAPHVHLMDSDFHDLEDRSQAGQHAPIHIGNGVKIGTRVVILRGVHIGDGATIAPGSIVTRDIPAGAHAGGIPARVQKQEIEV